MQGKRLLTCPETSTLKRHAKQENDEIVVPLGGSPFVGSTNHDKCP